MNYMVGYEIYGGLWTIWWVMKWFYSIYGVIKCCMVIISNAVIVDVIDVIDVIEDSDGI